MNIVLYNVAGCELDRVQIGMANEDEVNTSDVIEAISRWTLSPGDTICIEED